jgi:hypothetical protein
MPDFKESIAPVGIGNGLEEETGVINFSDYRIQRRLSRMALHPAFLSRLHKDENPVSPFTMKIIADDSPASANTPVSSSEQSTEDCDSQVCDEEIVEY